jgi:hypothetical protein
MIYAYGNTNPASSSPGATIVQHDGTSFGSTQMNLSQPISASGTLVTTGAIAPPWTRYDSLIVIHGASFENLLSCARLGQA